MIIKTMEMGHILFQNYKGSLVLSLVVLFHTLINNLIKAGKDLRCFSYNYTQVVLNVGWSHSYFRLMVRRYLQMLLISFCFCEIWILSVIITSLKIPAEAILKACLFVCWLVCLFVGWLVGCVMNSGVDTFGGTLLKSWKALKLAFRNSAILKPQ